MLGVLVDDFVRWFGNPWTPAQKEEESTRLAEIANEAASRGAYGSSGQAARQREAERRLRRRRVRVRLLSIAIVFVALRYGVLAKLSEDDELQPDGGTSVPGVEGVNDGHNRGPVRYEGR